MKKSIPSDQSREEKQATERDLRLDFFRGLALFSIFIDHVDWNSLVAQFTLQSVGALVGFQGRGVVGGVTTRLLSFSLP